MLRLLAQEMCVRVRKNKNTMITVNRSEFSASVSRQPCVPHAEVGHRWPQFLPDGNHYIFFVRSFDKERTRVYVGSLDSKQHRFALHTGYRTLWVPGYLLYLQDKTLVAQPFDAQKAELSG
jgi:hypothetical protein